jgi:hypothetical protein
VTQVRDSTIDNSSGKRHGRSKSKKGNRYLAAITGETAVAAGKTQTREGARYRRLARRRGKAKACVALGNTQLKVYHALLSRPGTRYEDLGPDYYQRQRDTRRQVAHHVGQPDNASTRAGVSCRLSITAFWCCWISWRELSVTRRPSARPGNSGNPHLNDLHFLKSQA